MNRYIEVVGDASGWLQDFDKLSDAYEFVKQLKRTDKHYGIQDIYTYWLCFEADKTIVKQEIKIIKRNGKYTSVLIGD